MKIILTTLTALFLTVPSALGQVSSLESMKSAIATSASEASKKGDRIDREDLSDLVMQIYVASKANPMKAGEVVAAALAARPEWHKDDLYEICRAALMGSEPAFAALKKAAYSVEDTYLREYGIQAARLEGEAIVNFWLAITGVATLNDALFNLVMTQLAYDSLSYAQHSIFVLDILETTPGGVTSTR